MLAAAVFIAATLLLAKALGTGALGPALHPLQVTHGRFVFAFVAIGLVALSVRQALRTQNLGLHVIRSACGFSGATLMFAAAAFIPLSDATAISFLNPVLAMVLAIPLLGERVGPVRWIAAAIALTGAVILLRPGAETFQPAALLALAAATFFAFEITVIKMLTGHERPIQVLFVNNAIGLVMSSVAVIAFWQPPTGAQWAGLIALGVLMAAAQGCFVNALARAEASLVVPFSYATLIFAALYDRVVFGVVPDTVSMLGAGVIVAGAALLGWREGRLARRMSAKE